MQASQTDPTHAHARGGKSGHESVHRRVRVTIGEMFSERENICARDDADHLKAEPLKIQTTTRVWTKKTGGHLHARTGSR